jgi:hypothetical protein
VLNHVTNYDDAAQTLRRNLSPRQCELEVLERFALGTQYEGLPDWFSDTDVPLWERAPCIVYPIVGTAGRSNVDLVLGESHFPTITSNPGEDDSGADGLDEDQSIAVDRALADLSMRTRFKAVARQALEHAQFTKSVATIVGTRNGRPFLELVRPKWCDSPQFDVDGRVTRLEIRYPYLTAPERQTDGTWRVRALLYRRVIDAVSDTTYLPLPADRNGREPKETAWVEDPERTVKHGLGFCPVHWYAHMKECSTVAQYDGHAMHESILDEVRGLDFALSQRHRAALFCGDPQIVEIGVEPGYNPSGPGRTATMPATRFGGEASASNPVTSSYRDVSTMSARRKSPGVVWQYEASSGGDVRVEYLSLPPGALDALDEHASDLRNKIAESLSVVILDPENVKFAAAMSGKAIEQLRSRQFDRCDQIRDDFGNNWIRPVVLLQLRVALSTDTKGKALEKARPILERFVADDGDAPMLFVRWPNGYLRPDPTDEQLTVATAAAAYAAGLITLRAALEKLAPIYGYEDIEQALASLEEERAKKQADALAIARTGTFGGAGRGAAGVGALDTAESAGTNKTESAP